MRRRIFFAILALFLLLPLASSSGPIMTLGMQPVQIGLCGEYGQYTTITASGIQNTGSQDLTSVVARLYMTGDSGLNHVTPQSVNLGNMVSMGQPVSASWTIQCSTPNAGTYIAYVNYTSTEGVRSSSLDQAYTMITVHETIPFTGNISIIEQGGSSGSEQDAEILADNTPTLIVYTSRDAVCKGTLDNDEPYELMDFLFYGSGKQHNYTFSTQINEGEHDVYVKCRDTSGNQLPSSMKISFIIDTSAPKISVIDPETTVVGEYTDLEISVDEHSECRYDDDDDDFDDLMEFDFSDGMTFRTTLTELDEDEDYSYFVMCRDNVGNFAEKWVDFQVVMPPKAKIYLEKAPPLPEGAFELTLIPTTKLRETPELYYEFNDDEEHKKWPVSLIRDGDSYNGYLVIDKQDKTRAGAFTFKGHDLDGNEGTEIIEGAVFLVDTIKPAAVQMLEGESSDGEISLRWYYEGEKALSFNIYRSLKQGVSYIDLLDDTSKTSFTDDDVAKNQVYYYKVAAVDKAGNVGPLSNEVSIYSLSGEGGAVVQNSNPPTQQTREWYYDSKKDIDSLLISLEWAENNLKEEATKEPAIEEMGLLRQVMSAKQDAEKTLAQLEGIDILKVSDTSLRDTLSKADALVSRTEKTVAQSMEIIKSTTVIQATSEQDVVTAVSEFLKTGNFTEKQIEKYTKDIRKLNEDMEVETSIKTARLKYIDNSEEIRVLVGKDVSYKRPEALADAYVVEIIPKTLAGDVSSIDVRTPGHTVLNPDPVLSWHMDSLGAEGIRISYIVFSEDKSESAKNTKSVVLTDPLYLTEGNSLITGLSIFVSNVADTGMELFGVILGIIIVLALGMYYMVVVNETDIGSYLSEAAEKMSKFPAAEKAISIFRGQGKDKGNKPSSKKSLDEKSGLDEKAGYVNLKTKAQDVPEQNGLRERNEKAGSLDMLDDEVRSYGNIFQKENPLKTIPGQYFYVRNGDVVRSIAELPSVLENMDDFTFYYHVDGNRNDFAEWVESIYHNPKIADMIRSAGHKDELIRIMKDIMEKK